MLKKPSQSTPIKSCRIPKMGRHKSGQARIRIDGRDIYLGRYGSPEAHRAYADHVARILGNTAEVPVEIASRGGRVILMAELVEAYINDMEGTLDGRTEDAVRTLRSDVKLAKEAILHDHAAFAAEDFGPVALQKIRMRLIKDSRLSRKFINRRTNYIRRIVRWGVSQELVDVSILRALESVTELRAGHPGTREMPSPRAVDPDHFRAVVEDLESRAEVQMACLLRFMALTGCRTAEARKARICDLDRVSRTLTIDEHKTRRKSGEPLVFELSSQAIAVIDRALLASGARDGGEPVFRSKRGAMARPTVATAVAASCKRLGIPRWSPHAIRRRAAVDIYSTLGIDATRALGGWDDSEMARHYAKDSTASLRREAVEALASKGSA